MIQRVLLPILLMALLGTPIGDAATAGLPDDWPADAAPPPDAKIVSSSIRRFTQSLAFELPAPEDEAIADVAERLQLRGWTTAPIDLQSRPRRIDGSNSDGRRITVLADETLHGSTAVLLTIYLTDDSF